MSEPLIGEGCSCCGGTLWDETEDGLGKGCWVCQKCGAKTYRRPSRMEKPKPVMDKTYYAERASAMLCGTEVSIPDLVMGLLENIDRMRATIDSQKEEIARLREELVLADVMLDKAEHLTAARLGRKAFNMKMDCSRAACDFVAAYENYRLARSEETG